MVSTLESPARRPTRRYRKAAAQMFIESLEQRLLLTTISGNILVNNPSMDTTTNDTQSETTLIVFNGTVLSSFNDSGSHAVSSTKFTGFARSTDGGNTFADLGVLPTATGGDGGDPTLSRDNTSGNIYLATLPFGLQNIVQVFRSTDGGQTFQTPTNAVTTHTGGQFDKEWIAVDNAAGAGQGNVYLVTRDFGSGNGIYFFRSTDQGALLLRQHPGRLSARRQRPGRLGRGRSRPLRRRLLVRQHRPPRSHHDAPLHRPGPHVRLRHHRRHAQCHRQ